MTAFAYCRVSGRAQDLASQRNAIEQAARLRGEKVLAWYEEKKSARTIQRPGLDRLRGDVRAGVIPPGSLLFVFRLDRLSRSGIRDTFEIVEELRAHDVKIVTVADGFTLDGPAAEIVLAVLSWSARMERQAINERISAARDRMEAEGRSWGRQPRLTPADCARVAAMKEDGRTIRQISVALKVPKSIVGRALLASRKVGPNSVRPPSGTNTSQQGASLEDATGTSDHG